MLTGPRTSPHQVAELKEVFDVLRRRVAGVVSESDDTVMRNVAASRLNGGRNNPIFGCTLDGQRLCVKLHKTDGRQRDRREWEALNALAASGIAVGPLPIGYAPGAQPVMAVEHLPGSGLGEHHITSNQVHALAEANREVHAMAPGLCQDSASRCTTSRVLPTVALDSIALCA